MVNSGNREEMFNRAAEFYKTNGFPQDEIDKVMVSHPGLTYSSKKKLDYHVLIDGDTFEFDDYWFHVLETPGHSPGHLCLYEPDKKILIAGDTILFDITPNISTWIGFSDPLKTYLNSLDRLYHLDVDIVLPGHRSILGDHRKRIDEIKAHHDARLNEVLYALESRDKNAYQIAACINWDIHYSTWESFPPVPKIFAIGSAVVYFITI